MSQDEEYHKWAEQTVQSYMQSHYDLDTSDHMKICEYAMSLSDPDFIKFLNDIRSQGRFIEIINNKDDIWQMIYKAAAFAEVGNYILSHLGKCDQKRYERICNSIV